MSSSLLQTPARLRLKATEKWATLPLTKKTSQTLTVPMMLQRQLLVWGSRARPTRTVVAAEDVVPVVVVAAVAVVATPAVAGSRRGQQV
jgi:hypothetical protein